MFFSSDNFHELRAVCLHLDRALPNYHYNMTTESGVVRRSSVVWIDTNTDADNHSVLLETLAASDRLNLHSFNNIDLAISFLSSRSFEHFQIAVNVSAADAFFTKQDAAKLQSTSCITMCVFVFGSECNEQLYARYLTYLQCNRKCWSKMPDVVERCLIISNDRMLLRRFCMIPDTLGMAIAQTIFLVEIQAFGNTFLGEVDPLEHQVILGSIETNVEFVGYMSSCEMSPPKLFQYLRFAGSNNLPKNEAQIVAVVMFGKRHGLSSKQIASICRFFSPGCCILPITLIKYLIRLWSLESPPFYRIVNQSLAECNIEDVHSLRYILYDYFELFNVKLLSPFVGTLYRGIHTSEENIAALISLVGKQIYFVCFTSTSKNSARAMVGGNVIFIIETLSKQQQDECRIQTNVDISTASQFPEEQEVIYAPLTTFLLLSITYIHDPNESVKYVIKLREQASSFFSQLFMDKIRLPNGTPFQSGTDMWECKIPTKFRT